MKLCLLEELSLNLAHTPDTSSGENGFHFLRYSVSGRQHCIIHSRQ